MVKQSQNSYQNCQIGEGSRQGSNRLQNSGNNSKRITHGWSIKTRKMSDSGSISIPAQPNVPAPQARSAAAYKMTKPQTNSRKAIPSTDRHTPEFQQSAIYEIEHQSQPNMFVVKSQDKRWILSRMSWFQIEETDDVPGSNVKIVRSAAVRPCAIWKSADGSFSNWVFRSSSISFFFLWVIVAHPGHASLRSLVDALLASLQAYVGLVVESLA